MAGAAGRRNILRDLTSPAPQGSLNNILNIMLPMTPPSPDESVIQHRGHRRKNATYNFDAPDPVFFKTPTKSPKKFSLSRLSTPTKIVPVRSSPRKKLILTSDGLDLDVETSQPNTKGFKRKRLQNVTSPLNFEKGLLALSHEQLVELVSTVAKSKPNFKEIFIQSLPVPDLVPVETKLHMLQQNVYKSLPRNVWGSQNDSFCFSRVKTHLDTFKRECVNQCQLFMESQHWSTIFEYILIAWKYSFGLPDWTNTAHNKIKNTCIKQICGYCATVLKKCKLEKAALIEIIDQMKEFENDSTVQACIKIAEKILATC